MSRINFLQNLKAQCGFFVFKHNLSSSLPIENISNCQHVKFGEGNVVECEGTHIRILFQCENIEKTFTYPTVFEKFVRFDSQDAQDRVTDDQNTAKEEAAKLENLRKLFMAEQAKKRKLEKAAKAAKKR